MDLHVNKRYLVTRLPFLSIGSLACGYSMLVISPAAFALYEDIPASTFVKEVITSVFPIGALVGCLG